MNGKEFISLLYSEFNAIRAQSENGGGISAFKITESGLLPVDENDDECDVVFGSKAIHFYVPNHVKDASRRPPASSKSPDVFRLLAQLPEFALLSDQELDTLSSHARQHRFPAGSVVVKQGDTGNSLFVLSQGSVRVYTEACEHEPEKTLATLAPGAYFGEMSLLTGEARRATLVANSDTVAYEITKEDLKPLFVNNDQFLKALSQHMAERELSMEHRELIANLLRQEQEKLNHSFSTKLKDFFGLK